MSSSTTLSEFFEKSTLNILSSGITSADDLIVRVLENAANPIDNPKTATNIARTEIVLAFLSFELS